MSTLIFRNSKKIKIFRTFPQKRIFLKTLKKIKENENFSKFSYNYVHLAHAILYVAIADDLVPRFIARSSATIVMTGCSVHSKVLHFFIQGDYI